MLNVQNNILRYSYIYLYCITYFNLINKENVKPFITIMIVC